MAGELNTYGFNPQHEAARLARERVRVGNSELQANLGTFFNHGLTDTPVAQRYSLLIEEDGTQRPVTNQGEIRPPIQTNPHQRGGITQPGMQRVRRALDASPPGTITLQYSPIGPSSFEGTDRGEYEGYYDTGQLYIYRSNRDRAEHNTDATAVTVTNELPIIGILRRLGLHPPGGTEQTTEEFIKHYTLSPVSTNLELADFTNMLRNAPWAQIMIHQDSHDTVFTLTEIADQIDAAFNGTLILKGEALAGELIERFTQDKGGRPFTERQIKEIYLTATIEYGRRYGWDRVRIATACGGSEQAMGDLLNELARATLQGELFTPNTTLFLKIRTRLDFKNDERITHCGACGRLVRFSASRARRDQSIQCTDCQAAIACGIEDIIFDSKAA